MELDSNSVNDALPRNREVAKSLEFGDYLVQAGVCQKNDVQRAIKRQSLLGYNDGEKKIGAILLEMGLVSKKHLTETIRQQNLDRLSESDLFYAIDRPLVLEVYDNSDLQSYHPGDLIFRQNENSNFAAVILRGTVNLVHRPARGKEVDIQVLRAGESFGEMDLLSGWPRLVTARCLEPTDLLIIPGEFFKLLHHRHAELSQSSVRKWFDTIVAGKLQSSVYKEYHYKELLSKKEALPCFQTFGSSKVAKQIRHQINTVSSSDKPVLLVGEAGTMRSRVAQLIYEASVTGDGPFILFDPQTIPSFITESMQGMASTHYQSELAQIGALFGYSKDELQTETPWQGFLKVAHNGILVINNIGNLEQKVQILLARYLRTGIFYPVNSDRPANAAVRIILTTSDDLDLTKELVDCFEDSTINLPPLRSRKRDLKQITNRLLAEMAPEVGKSVQGIGQEAMNTIMAYDWPGNFRELEDVLRRALNLAKGPLLTREEIFIGRVSITGKSAFNLLTVPVIGHFFKSPFFPIAPQIFIALLFLVVIAMGLFGNPSPESNVSLLLIWANWEPLLIISCFLLARIWCSFCPIGFIGEFFQKIRRKRYKISAQYLNYGFVIGAVGLAIIFWSQAALEMWQHPKETAGLLVAMLLSAVIFAYCFEGKIWCRYVCPLGQMVATFSRVAAVEVRSNYYYCSNECVAYDCHAGNGAIQGCRMSKGPFALDTNQNCTLCGNCIKLCPHESVRLNLRPPGWELYNAKSADFAARLFIPLLWGTQLFRALERGEVPEIVSRYAGQMPVSLALLLVFCVAFAYLLAIGGCALMGDTNTAEGVTSSSVYVLAMLPMIYANEIALRLVPLLNHAADFFVILGNQVGYTFPHIAFRLDMQSITILQFFLVATSLLISIFIVKRYRKKALAGPTVSEPLIYLPFLAMAAISIFLL